MSNTVADPPRTLTFHPERVYFEPRALAYPLGREIYAQASALGLEIRETTSHNQIRDLPGETPVERYWEAKRTLVVGVRKGTQFQTSRPSADFQFPLATGCPGHCHYCYLNTNLSNKPYVRIYANIEELLALADRHAAERAPAPTTFDGSCTSDPLAIEAWGQGLRHAIPHFAHTPMASFRFVSKYTAVEPLLDLEHNGRTRVRFSVNGRSAAAQFEKGVPRVPRRIEAAARVAGAGYRMGFLVAPVIAAPGWEEEYRELLETIADLDAWRGNDLRFEVVLHRFTPRAKATIEAVYPSSALEMDESSRRWKWGQFGYGKYLYDKDVYHSVEAFFRAAIAELFPYAELDYIV
ncbi:MAG TPA: spore photoproduct lyase [Limnochordia bacterium]|nr:spore photoproduct lyase [Limnochordia bacterium]